MAVLLRSRVSRLVSLLIYRLTLLYPTETSSGPGSHCSHRHPHAEPSPPPTDLPQADEDEAATSTPKEEADPSAFLPSRLDRLIAFLDSYFGRVELIRPEDVEASPSPAPSPPPATVAAEMEVDTGAEVDPNPLEPAEKAEQELAEAAEEEQNKERLEKEERIRKPRVPVIRVKLDDYVADVMVESLVSFLCPLISISKRRADRPLFAERHFDT